MKNYTQCFSENLFFDFCILSQEPFITCLDKEASYWFDAGLGNDQIGGPQEDDTKSFS